MPRAQVDSTAAALLGTWTDSDTAMQIVGTSLGMFGPHLLDPEAALSNETPLRNALFDVLLSLVEGGALDMRPTDDGLYAFRWRPDYAIAGLISETSNSIDIAPPSPYIAELVQLRRERDEALGRAQFAEALAEERERLLRSTSAPAPAKRSRSRSAAPAIGDELDAHDRSILDVLYGAQQARKVAAPAEIDIRNDADEPAEVVVDAAAPKVPTAKRAKVSASKPAPAKAPGAAKSRVKPKAAAAAPAKARATAPKSTKAKPAAPASVPEIPVSESPVAPADAPEAVSAPEVVSTPEVAAVAEPTVAPKAKRTRKPRTKAAATAVVAPVEQSAPAGEPSAIEAPAAVEPETNDVVYLTPPEPVVDIDLTDDDIDREPDSADDDATPRRAKWSGYTLDKPRVHLSSVERLADEG